MSPEQAAREQIDAMLRDSGWAIQDYAALNLSAARGIAMREVPLKSGRCDYLLLVDRLPVGVVEAKKEGTTLSTVSGRRNDVAKKITYRAVHAVTGQPADCEQLIREPSAANRSAAEIASQTPLQDTRGKSTRRRRARQGERGGAPQFRLSPQLRIAVTVDMIATGTDITEPRGSAIAKRGATLQSPAESRDNPLEVLLFLRDVRSRVYFEQMKGRGTASTAGIRC